MTDQNEPASPYRLISVTIDESTIARGTPDQEHERKIAIYDLIESNIFELENGRAGPYALHLGLNGNRLVFDLRDEQGQPIFAHVLALSPFRMVIKDYFMICASYYDAIRNASAEKIEAIDMARRGLHNEGAELVNDRLKGKIKTDFDTSRRIFTLIAALVWTGRET
ncbi:MAG: UPF0262 family protein [Beijerinckiaceae bacterium]|nr:UPF0262 family protein [Beijerinckiaceae bacterium]